jgi:hypothetical protein
MPDLIRFYVNQSQDPEGIRTRDMLRAHLACERMQAFSHLLLYALVLVGAVVWIAAVQPGLLPPWASHLGEATWGAGLVGLIMVFVHGRHCGKRAQRLADESKPDSPLSGNDPE